MNEFSKEELEYLHDIMGTISIAGHPINDDALYEKKQSMIDDYCEHEFRHSNEAHFKCIHCGSREK